MFTRWITYNITPFNVFHRIHEFFFLFQVAVDPVVAPVVAVEHPVAVEWRLISLPAVETKRNSTIKPLNWHNILDQNYEETFSKLNICIHYICSVYIITVYNSIFPFRDGNPLHSPLTGVWIRLGLEKSSQSIICGVVSSNKQFNI